MPKLFESDPLTTSWVIALSTVFVLAVVIPMLRLVVALCIHAYAAITGQRHLHGTAARVMPRTAQLIGSLVIGITSIAAPTWASGASGDEQALASINLDRDAGASDAPALRAAPAVPAPLPVRSAITPTAQLDFDRDGGSSHVAASVTPQVAQHSSPAPASAGSIYVVRTGDSLWSIAQAHLDDATDATTTEGWKAIWRANRALIGDHPELIRPGQHIMLPPGALA